MSPTNLLSPEQEALLPVYREKWRRIIASRKPVDRDRAIAGIERAYAELGLAIPRILFFDSPVAAAKMFEDSQSLDRLGNFVSQFHLAPSLVDIFIDRLTKENLPARITAPSQSSADVFQDFQTHWESMHFLPLMQMQQVNSALSILGMNRLALEVQTPFIEALQELAKSQGQPSPLIPITNNLTSAIARGITRFWIWQQQQNMRSLVNQYPWGGFFLDASDSLWKNLQPLTDPITTEVQNFSAKVWDIAWEKLWEILSSHPQIKESHSQFDRLWQNLQKFLASSNFNLYSLTDVWALPTIDFSISVLGEDYGIKNWSAIAKLTQECCWIYPFERTCVVIERPLKYSFIEGDRLHGEGQPALQFRDGYAIYAYNGVILPEKYGKVHPDRWLAEWVVSERNVEIRRVLIQGIGYERLCQELRAETLDTWREYHLLKIADIPTRAEMNGREVEDEAIHLLKMICPSTAHIHILRVPPDLNTAREAIRWVNWDIDPEDFAIAT